MTDYEKFVNDRGWEFKTEETLKAAYDRILKCRDGILITQEEFLTESKKQDDEATKEVYNALVALVKEGKLEPVDVYQYARFKWCLKDANTIVAYLTADAKFKVNNCDTEVSEAEAKIKVCEEWGFEASRVQIIGTPYYESTDWQFIRFDCAHMTWLWANENLYQVFN